MTLFDVGPLTLDPPPPEEPLSADRRRTIRNRAKLDAGIHPVSGRPLRPEGGICGECVNHRIERPGDRGFHKCILHRSSSAATDIRVSWPACIAYEKAPT